MFSIKADLTMWQFSIIVEESIFQPIVPLVVPVISSASLTVPVCME